MPAAALPDASVDAKPATRTDTHHVAALTGVRAFAALWVLLFHSWLNAGSPPLAVALGAHVLDLRPLVEYGWLGLDVFFILSGFLLARQAVARVDALPSRTGTWCERHTGERYWPYLRRRILRVYPAYYACVTALVVLALAGLYRSVPGVVDMALHLVMSHNLIERYIVSLNGVFWTLPFEWHFYLLFPFMFALLDRRGGWVLYAIAVAIVALTKLAVIATGDGYAQVLVTIRLDAFAAGMAMGAWSARRPPRRYVAAVAFWTGLALLFATPWVYAGMTNVGHYMDSLRGWSRPFWIQAAVTLMLLGLAGERHAGVALFANRVVFALGLVSYSIYLWHVPIIELAPRMGLVPVRTTVSAAAWGRLLLGAVPATLAVAVISYRLFERPFQRAGRAGARGMLRHPISWLVGWAAVMELVVALA
ncbi:MAG: acyltransferase [Proteobacteria bacterium]|nr:acyltransferase [Pseudomonadota bacterium]